MAKMPTKIDEKTVSEDQMLQSGQRLRLQRFGMALLTYSFIILAAILVTRLGLGEMTVAQWLTFIGLCLLGNTVFFILFYTNKNLSFSDPSLTREQIVFAGFWGMVPLYLLPEARPIVLMFYLPGFSFGILRLTQRQYLSIVPILLVFYASILALEYFQDRQGFNIQYQLFLFFLYGILLTWFAFFGGYVSNIRRRLRVQKEEIQKANEDLKIEMQERKRAQIEKDNLIIELKDALAEVKTLSGLLPICSHCKKIRDDKGYWNQIEAYIQDRSEAEFSHSICQECAKKYYPDMDIYDEDEVQG
jgi:branched-subunit amino acid transport protein